ncbi:MAG: hypothetical protein JNM31_01990 [Flavobacteriales bacterium]|nr:hypothetical protein [Flavobacteriales bacterium]
MKKTLLLMLLLPASVAAQKSKVPVSTTWDKTITVVPDQITNGKYRLPAYSVSIFETDGPAALEMLRNEYKAISAQVSGKDPLKAAGCVLPEIDPTPLLVMARAETDKRANLAKLTICFALNDSTAATNDEAMKAAVRNVGVRLNRGVVSKQVTAQEKLIADTRTKHQSAQGAAASNQRKIDTANGEIAKIQAKKGKLEAEKAGIEHDIAVLDEKYKRTQDVKDLDRLNKARKRLAGNGTETAKLSQAEAKQKATISKLQGNVGQASAEVDTHSSNIEQHQQVLDALRRKLAAIQ